jgi:outer membrane protein, heavy metal efflux system
MRRLAWVVWLGMPGASLAAAQEPALSLAQARARAEAASPDLAAARHAVTAAAARERQAGAMPNPQLIYSREQTSGAAGATQNIVMLDQPLALTGARSARRGAAVAERRVAEARLAAAVAALREDVVRAYAAAAGAGRRRALADDAATAFTRALRTSEQRLAAGDVSPYEHRRLRLEAARYAGLAQAARADEAVAIEQLRVLAGFPGAPQLSDTTVPPALELPAESLAAAASRNADVVAAERDVEAAVALARVARAERTPVPSLGAGLKNERAADGSRSGGFALQLALPLPVWDRRAGAVAAAEAETARRGSALERQRRAAATDVRAAAARHAALETQLAALDRELGDEAARALRSAEVAYTEGDIPLLAWLDAVRAYYEAAITRTELWTGLLEQRAALERLTGLSLFE